MSSACEQIEKLLEDVFHPQYMKIEDESWKHAGHAGVRESGGGHFIVHIAADAFHGKTRIQCHRMVNQALQSLFPATIHALSIHIKPLNR